MVKKVSFAKWFIVIPLVLLGMETSGQTNCTEQLRIAQRRYDSGLLDEIPSILQTCLERGFTKEEKTNAYKLLIQTYLFSDWPEKADEVMLRFLRDFPEYTIAPNDHNEFINLYQTYRTTPIMKIEAGLGTNYSMLWVKEVYGVENLNETNAQYSSTFGVNFEVNYLNNIFSDFDVSFGFSFSLLRLGYLNDPFEHTSITATYSNLYVGIPLALRYNRKLLGISLFAKAGAEPVYLISSTINFSRDISGGQDPITGNENVISYQKRLDIRPLLSVGIDQRIGSAQLLLTAGFKFGTIRPSLGAERYANEDLFRKYFFIPDDFWLHQSFISLSYVFSIYQPKKIF